jgi:hypothetical protein
MMYQCRLRRGTAEVFGWIEERGAKVGAKVELKADDNNQYDVVEVFQPGMEESKLKEKQDRDRNAFGSLVGKK